MDCNANKVQISPDALFRDMAGESVILDLAGGKYFGMDETGTRVWQLLQETGDPQQVVAVMATEYQVERETLLNDVLTFVDRLKSLGLVKPAPASVTVERQMGTPV